MGIVLPGRDKRLAITGSTGSGKTFAGIFHMITSYRAHPRPVFVFDFKRDKSLKKLPLKELSLNTKRLPYEPGLYVFRPIPGENDEQVTALLWLIWALEECLVYIDEGYMIGRFNKAFNALLTQGRDKNIQMITLSQRPAWMSLFVFSEADYFQVFRLNNEKDYGKLQEMISIDITSSLPKYYSHWYDVGENIGAIFKPVPRFDIMRKEIVTDQKRNIRML